MNSWLSAPFTPAEIAALAVVGGILIGHEIGRWRAASLARKRDELRFLLSPVVDHREGL